MISPDMLAFIIASFCSIKDPHITKNQKLDCIEFVTNCAIKQNGWTTEKIMNDCRDMWSDIERKRK